MKIEAPPPINRALKVTPQPEFLSSVAMYQSVLGGGDGLHWSPGSHRREAGSQTRLILGPSNTAANSVGVVIAVENHHFIGTREPEVEIPLGVIVVGSPNPEALALFDHERRIESEGDRVFPVVADVD